MIANYHSHTARCRHARGAEGEYVENALERGLQVYGFSDHTPQFFPGDYYSTMRMFPEELPGYCETVRALQKEYRGRLEIPLGLEVEYYPSCWKELLPRLRDHGIEYLILGQHWLGSEEHEPYCGRPLGDPHLLERWCRQVMEGLDTGVFTYLAHPDLFYFVGSDRDYVRHMRPMIRHAKEGGIPLEINLLGILENRHYPKHLFWELVAEENAPVILGIDAHSPQQVLETHPEQKALEMVRQLGLTLLENVDRKRF